MDDLDSLLSSQNFRLLDPTPFQPPPQLPLQKVATTILIDK